MSSLPYASSLQATGELLLFQPPEVALQLFITDPLDLLLFLLGQLLSDSLIHLDHAQGPGVVEHLHILKPLEGVGSDKYLKKGYWE